uniref:Uncharacterized protein n=1 Tax=Arundo donax TaxID=35708 RepID=A0A0A9FTF3_ARUDO
MEHSVARLPPILRPSPRRPSTATGPPPQFPPGRWNPSPCWPSSDSRATVAGKAAMKKLSFGTRAWRLLPLAVLWARRGGAAHTLRLLRTLRRSGRPAPLRRARVLHRQDHGVPVTHSIRATRRSIRGGLVLRASRLRSSRCAAPWA